MENTPLLLAPEMLDVPRADNVPILRSFAIDSVHDPMDNAKRSRYLVSK